MTIRGWPPFSLKKIRKTWYQTTALSPSLIHPEKKQPYCSPGVRQNFAQPKRSLRDLKKCLTRANKLQCNRNFHGPPTTNYLSSISHGNYSRLSPGAKIIKFLCRLIMLVTINKQVEVYPLPKLIVPKKDPWDILKLHYVIHCTTTSNQKQSGKKFLSEYHKPTTT